MKSTLREIIEWLVCIIVAVALALLVRYYIGTPTIVQQSSMFPTLKENERLWLNRWGRTTKKLPERGDIITFEAPSVTYPSLENIDFDNPVAKYDYNPKGLIGKFIYYILETNKTSYIKRIIGVAGDHIKIEDGKVYRNGEQLDEPYLQENIRTESKIYSDIIVPENCVFAMGDNRENSTDCRDFGCIPIRKIESKVAFRFWPLNKFGKIK